MMSNDKLDFNGLTGEYFCIDCKSKALIDTTYDAIYCKDCNQWLEDICKDKDCEFCSGKIRPDKPIV